MADKYAPFVLKKLTRWEEAKISAHIWLIVGLFIVAVGSLVAALL